MDDGSTDDTFEIASKFPVRYVRIENSGPGIARNTGAALATADWIAFCDADDVWRPNYLERFVSHLRPNSKYGFANFVDLVDNQWTRIEKFCEAPDRFFSDPELPLYEKLIEFSPIWPSATILRRQFFSEVGGFTPELSRLPTEDFEFALRCNEIAPAVVMHEALVGIRKHPENFSSGRIRQHLSDALILEWARSHHSAGARYASKIERSVVRRRCAALNEAFVQGDFKQLRQIATLLPSSALDVKGRAKVFLARSRLVPASLARSAFGRCT